MLPFSKPCDLAGDAEKLAPHYAMVDCWPDALQGQHSIRRWEYAMALHAIQGWENTTLRMHTKADYGSGHLESRLGGPPQSITVPGPLEICDVGGAGSNFWQVLLSVTSEDIIIVDPNAGETPQGQVQWIHEDVVQFAATQRHDRFDALTAISVIEHVKDLRPFLRACRMLLKPGGLLFLTTDYWDQDGPDVAHFHWMRERVYNPETIRALQRSMRDLGYKTFGEGAWNTYPGHQLYDYSVCALAMVKA